MDPLDPLTEIIKSGQVFSPLIALERILWLMIGFFFFGAISTSIIRSMKQQGLFRNKSFLASFKSFKEKGEFPEKINDDE